MAKQVTRSGNGYFTDDSEYVVSGGKVTRGDGSYMTFGTEAEAHEAALSLASGESTDDQYVWTE